MLNSPADIDPVILVVLVTLSLASLVGWLVLLVYLLRHERGLAIGMVISFVFVVILSLLRLTLFQDDDDLTTRLSIRVIETTTMTLVPWGLLLLLRRRGY